MQIQENELFKFKWSYTRQSRKTKIWKIKNYFSGGVDLFYVIDTSLTVVD